MLVLTRRPGQGIRIGPGVEIQVVKVEGDRVTLGIVAPRHVAVVRSELVEQISGETRDAADARARLRVMLMPRRSGSQAEPEQTPDGSGPEIA